MTLLKTKSLTIGYRKSPEDLILQRNINMSVEKGEIISLMGQNGVGKTTFIKSVTGLLEPISGEVNYGETDLRDIQSNILARKISIVLTEKPTNLNITPIELVSITRHPYSNWIGLLSRKDKEIIEWALSETQINYIANKKLYELSDGQLQKVMIARALAQETDLIILDEPTAHLDLNNKIEVMLLLKKIAAGGKGMLISTHDLQVSTQFSDRIILFNFNSEVVEGIPEDLILEGTLQQGLYLSDYGYDMIHGTINHGKTGYPIEVTGKQEVKYWIERALLRKGFNPFISRSDLEINGESKNQIRITSKDKQEIAKDVEDMLRKLAEFIKSKAPRDAELL